MLDHSEKDPTIGIIPSQGNEKALFEQLCKTEGLTPSKAIRSFILACNERGAITEPEIQDAKYIAR